MKKVDFVSEGSIVREIWGKSDTILLIFAGASAEFALNKAVDWLYYTGKLPEDPLGRLFSTVSYAREIVFSDKISAQRAIKRINTIHASVESKRGRSIPDWAYRDVLFMLIDFSIRSYEILERKLTKAEKMEVFEVFSKVGEQMHLNTLPENYDQYLLMRARHMKDDLLLGAYSRNLYQQYRKHLGWFRYRLLLESQILILPKTVRQKLGFRPFSYLSPFMNIFKISKSIKLDHIIKGIILPAAYKREIQNMDRLTAFSQ